MRCLMLAATLGLFAALAVMGRLPPSPMDSAVAVQLRPFDPLP
jgi:hypothetical protein